MNGTVEQLERLERLEQVERLEQPEQVERLEQLVRLVRFSSANHQLCESIFLLVSFITPLMQQVLPAV